MSTVLRPYLEEELGADGYPLAWHRCPGCDGAGWRCAATSAAAGSAGCCTPGFTRDDRGARVPHCPSMDGCPDCHEQGLCGGAGSIKQLVRLVAGERCVRCGHPYRKGEHGRGEWTPCDTQCTHGGPLRGRGIDGPGDVLITDGDLLRDNVNAGDWARGGARIEAQWRILTVHHLDGDKANCRWWNLTALCQRCHLQIQGKVVMHRRWLHEHSAWFRPYVAGFYAFAYLGEELTRDEAEERVDELLALEHRQLSFGGSE